MHRRILLGLIFTLTCFGWGASADASGLGKFVAGGSERTNKPCDAPAAASGVAHRTRFSALAGVSGVRSDEPAFSVYGDLGFRLVSNTGGCRQDTGWLWSKTWWWHSLILGVDAELIPSRIEKSPVGLMVAYDVRRRAKGFLSDLNLPFGIGLAAGPHLADGEWGVGAAVFLRAIFDVRIGVDYDFQRGASTSIHLGVIDPHLVVLNLLDDS